MKKEANENKLKLDKFRIARITKATKRRIIGGSEDVITTDAGDKNKTTEVSDYSKYC